jgi:archaellum component FlaC
MTSVLYSAGLNYQINNPVRIEINRLTSSINDLRKLVDTQSAELNLLRAKVNVLEKESKKLGGSPSVGNSGGGGQ